MTNQHASPSPGETHFSRRGFVRATTAAALGTALEGVAAPPASSVNEPRPDLPAAVQMQFMRPAQLEQALRDFPVVYVPFGLIEWHGRHLPLGTDAIKAHAILVKTAEQAGGVVYPPVYFHDAFPQAALVRVLTHLFDRLKKTGFRVILGVSGHNVEGQIDMINQALVPVVTDGTVAGLGLWDISLCQGPESNGDHAAQWETSSLMCFYPELVDLAALGDGPLVLDGKPPDGIEGADPRLHASAALGRRSAELAAQAIGRKARELLAALPRGGRSAPPPRIQPGEWWMI